MDGFAGNLSSGYFLGSGALSEVLGSIGFQGAFPRLSMRMEGLRQLELKVAVIGSWP